MNRRRSSPYRRSFSNRLGRVGGIAVLAVLAGGVLVGCGGDGAEADPPTSSPPVSVTTSPSGSPSSGGGEPTAGPSSGTAQPGEVWSPEPVTVERPDARDVRLMSMRSGHNVEADITYDRLVLEFTGGLPGYTARYVEQVVQPGSGAPLPLEGQATFELVLTPAAAHNDQGESTLQTPRSGGGLPSLVTYELAGDFEGYVHIGIGLDDVVGFRIIELEDPYRLAIDFPA